MEAEQLAARYPRTVELNDGTAVEIRLLGPGDGDDVLRFARRLPEEDLLYLRMDITQPATVEGWMRNIASGLTTSLAAYDGTTLVGYASVHRDPVPWTRRVGEIRVNIDSRYRSKGLGRNLTAQIFDVARRSNLKKLVAHVTDDQAGAKAALRRLGFMPEALLADSVEDRAGRLRDLVIMAYDVEGLTDQMDEPLRV